MTTNNVVACHCFLFWKRTRTTISNNTIRCHSLVLAQELERTTSCAHCPASWLQQKKMTMGSAVAYRHFFFWKIIKMTIDAGHSYLCLPWSLKTMSSSFIVAKNPKTRMTPNIIVDHCCSFSWKKIRTTMSNNVAFHRYLCLFRNLKKTTNYSCFPPS